MRTHRIRLHWGWFLSRADCMWFSDCRVRWFTRCAPDLTSIWDDIFSSSVTDTSKTHHQQLLRRRMWNRLFTSSSFFFPSECVWGRKCKKVDLALDIAQPSSRNDTKGGMFSPFWLEWKSYNLSFHPRLVFGGKTAWSLWNVMKMKDFKNIGMVNAST